MQAKSGRVFETINPETGSPLTSIAEGDAADVDLAVAAARRAFDSSAWTLMTPHDRTRALLRIADKLECHSDELAALESLDNGMPLWYSTAMLANVVQTFRYYAGWPTKIHGTTSQTDPSCLLYTLREPVGVCALIIAWNVPLLMAAIKIATALACGNTVILKPAEQASLTSLRLGELILEADLPSGVVNIVTGFGATAGAALAVHPDVDKISFTGSIAVGRQILQASTGNLKRVTLELGGKSPNIVFPDADIEKALQAAVRSFCGNSGQACSAGTRLFVHESVRENLVQRLTDIAASYKVGSPFAADTKLGPLISERQMKRVLSYIDVGLREGARLELGGSRVGDVGYFVEPTIFSAVSNDMTIAREEIFGPVLSVISFKDEQDAVRQSNQSDYGLAAAVWTRDIARAHKVARALKSGRVWINTYGEADQMMAFGGYKQSGIGREFGAESIEAFTQSKAVLVRF